MHADLSRVDRPGQAAALGPQVAGGGIVLRLLVQGILRYGASPGRPSGPGQLGSPVAPRCPGTPGRPGCAIPGTLTHGDVLYADSHIVHTDSPLILTDSHI